MRFGILLALFLASAVPSPVIAQQLTVMTHTHTYEARIRLNGKVSTTQIQASDASQAKKLVQAQYGPSVTVLSVKRVD